MNDPASLEPYTLHIYDISYFSGKMQAYLAYKGIPHRTHEIRWKELVDRVAPRTGLVEVPVVECADGSFMRDSTAMIEWFEQHYGVGSVLPDDPASAFYCRLLEDYADEGLWRPALYFRWAFDKDAELYSRRFTEDFLSYPLTPAAMLRVTVRDRQRRVYLRGEGITPENRADVERHYTDVRVGRAHVERPGGQARGPGMGVWRRRTSGWNRTAARACGTALPAFSARECASRRRTKQPLHGNARREALPRAQGGTVPGVAPQRAATATDATRATRGGLRTGDAGSNRLP